MKCLLIFPPGWMQFGPYLSLPLLKGCLQQAGVDVTLLDLNIEFYDWAASAATLDLFWPQLRERERDGAQKLGGVEYAKLAKALLSYEHLRERVEPAKDVLRSKELYLDHRARERAKADLCASLNVVECAFERFQLSMNQIIFGCGRRPERVLQFLRSDANMIRIFYQQRVRELLSDGEFDVIGFSLPAWEQLVPALTIAAGIRDDFGDSSHICMGGNYITRLVGTWGDKPHPYTNLVDSFSVFEGEGSLVQLCQAVASGTSLKAVENLVYREGEQLRRTHSGEVDINAVPCPDFDGLPLHKYFAPEPILPLFTSRSCAYKCSFCTIPYASSQFRQRTAENVANDMSQLSSKYGTRLFTFVDETLMVTALRGVADQVRARNLDVRWYGETRFHPKFDRDLAQALFQSGCRKLQFGLESYNQRVLNLMKKGVRVDCIPKNIEVCLEAGIAIHLFTFAGFPGETEEEARHTQEYARQVVAESAEKYGIPYSTVGSGAFNLEVYSDVYFRPEQYGVQFKVDVSALEADEAFEIEYTVDSGLTRAQAARLVREFDNSAVFEEACDATGLVWWKALLGNQTNEDEDFFLYCFGASPGTGDSASDSPSLSPADFVPPGSTAPLRLSSGVVVREFSRDFLQSEWRPLEASERHRGPDQSVLAFYDPESDLAVVLPIAVGRGVLKCLTGHRRLAEAAPEVEAAVNRLLRYRLLKVEPEGGRRSLSGQELLGQRRTQLRYNDDVRILRLPSVGVALFNATTQEVVEASTSAAWLASLVQERSQSAADFIERATAESPLSKTTVELALSQLVDRQVLVALPTGC